MHDSKTRCFYFSEPRIFKMIGWGKVVLTYSCGQLGRQNGNTGWRVTVTKKSCPVALVLALSIGSVLGQAQAERPAAPSPTTLTDTQKRAMEAIGKDLESKVQVAAVLKLASLAKDYDRNILAEKPDAALEQKLGDELAETVSQLAAEAVRVRVRAVGEMAKLLTPDQKKLLLAELDKPDANPDLVELIKKVLGDKK